MPVDFKSLLKLHRLRAGYGLRQFADLIGDLPSNYAGTESGARRPWKNSEKQRIVAEALGLREGSAEWDEFFIALKGNTGLPPDMEHLLERPMIPVLLRTIDERKLSDSDLRELVEYITKGKKRGKSKK